MEKLPEYLQKRKSDYLTRKLRDQRSVNIGLGMVVAGIVLIILLDSGII